MVVDLHLTSLLYCECRYSTAVGSPHDLAWVFSVEETVKAGTQLEVVRGPHWRFGNQDGGFHNSGRIVAVKGPFMVVAWNGQDEDEVRH